MFSILTLYVVVLQEPDTVEGFKLQKPLRYMLSVLQ